MMRVDRVVREPDAHFPSVFDPPAFSGAEQPIVAQVLETFYLADGDMLRAVIGVESWVTRTAWISYGGPASWHSFDDALQAQDFALRELGMRALLGFSRDLTERTRVETELKGNSIGSLRSVGRPTTIFTIENR